MLAHFNESFPVVLVCEASPYRIGTVLNHELPKGQKRTITYYLCILSSVERNYAQIDKKALATMAGVKKFHNLSVWLPVLYHHGPQAIAGSLCSELPNTAGTVTPHPVLVHFPVSISVLSPRGHADTLRLLLILVSATDPPPAYCIISWSPCQNLHYMAPTLLHIWPITGSSSIFSIGYGRGGLPVTWTLSSRNISLASMNYWLTSLGKLSGSSHKLRNQVMKPVQEAHPSIVHMKALTRSYIW